MKILITLAGFNTKLSKLKKKNLYSEDEFKKDFELFLTDEKNKKFRKHKITRWKQDTVFSITLKPDLRALYFFIRKKDDSTIEYVFFDIGSHDDVY